MGVFNKKPSLNSADPLLADLRRGGGGKKPLAAHVAFPTSPQILGELNLGMDPRRNQHGAIALGVVNAKMSKETLPNGRTVRAAIAGEFIGRVDDRGGILIASPREDKGRGFIINNCYSYPFGMVIVDPKGDAASETAAYRAEVLNQPTILLDPFNSASKNVHRYSASYNPLAGGKDLDLNGLVRLAALIAEAIIKPGTGNEEHWADTARSFLEAIVLFVLLDEEYKDRRDLVTVYELVMLGVESGLKDTMLSCNLADGLVAIGAHEFYDKADRERSGVLSTLRKHVKWIGYYPEMAKMLRGGGGGEDVIADLASGPMSVYVCLPASMMRPCSGFLRLVLSMALNVFETSAARRDFQTQANNERCLFLVDEASVLGKMPRLQEAASLMPGMGVLLWSVWQSLGQIRENFGAGAETFIGAAGTHVYMGSRDQETLRYIEQALGSTLVYSPSQRATSLESAVKHGETGVSYSITPHPLMTAAEIARTIHRDDLMGRMLVFLAGIGPVICTRAYYDKHPAIKELARRAR